MSDCRKKAPFPLLDEVARLKCRLSKDFLVLVRIGDWYELFGEDATIAAPILNASLTMRAGVPMCGVPYYAIDTNLAKLIRAGKSVALAQRRDDGKGPRFIHRIITPGTPQGVDGDGK